jgi:hypothetical protein
MNMVRGPVLKTSNERNQQADYRYQASDSEQQITDSSLEEREGGRRNKGKVRRRQTNKTSPSCIGVTLEYLDSQK